MAEAETPTRAEELGIEGIRGSFHNWAIGLSDRQKMLYFWGPITLIMFILVFPPTFEAWINNIQPRILWIPWSFFITHTLLFIAAIWAFLLQRVDNAQAVARGEI